MIELMDSFQNIDTLFSYIRSHTISEIIVSCADRMNTSMDALIHYPMGGYSRGGTSGSYYYTLLDMKQHAADYLSIYDRLYDNRSKEVFTSLCCYRLCPDRAWLERACDLEHIQYFDPSIIRCGSDEVFVDCGGYTGDTVEEYLKQYGAYRSIYVFEPSPANHQECMKRLKGKPDIHIFQAGVGLTTPEKLKFSIEDSASSLYHHTQSDYTEIDILSLDECIQEKITYIKMDIEGSEIDAIEGARQHIRTEAPKLAICLYHMVSDLWEILQLVFSIHPGYRFYIRHYEKDRRWETVLYAVADCTGEKATAQNQPSLYILPAGTNGYNNVELLKDCGLLPYAWYRNYGKKCVFVTAKLEDDYSYINTLDSARLHFLPCAALDSESVIESLCTYIKTNYRDMDLLFLHGGYPEYFEPIELYRSLRPDGKICLKLDANAGWMDRYPFHDPSYRHFLDKCNIISVESRRLQKMLTRKWKRKIEYIPNGFYCFSDLPFIRYETKENIILTVGRIGTQQKNNELLLDAFSLVAALLPDWKLRLVGPVEPDFQNTLQKYFNLHPELMDRITLTGVITDRNTMAEEYERAKIFVLTSNWEGYPNVYPEATLNGCCIITSSVNGSEDITDGSQYGFVYPIGDVQGLADALLHFCRDEEYLKHNCQAVQEYVRQNFDYSKLAGRLWRLLKLNGMREEESHEYFC